MQGMRRVNSWALVLASVVVPACGGRGDSSSSSPLAPYIGGQYEHSHPWTIDLLRLSDGHRALSECSGMLFIRQSDGASVVGQLTGAVTVGAPCWPMSFDLTGLVWPDGRIELTTNGPVGPGMQCSPAVAVQYKGSVTQGGSLSAHGNATLRCADGEEYAATYALAAERTVRYGP